MRRASAIALVAAVLTAVVVVRTTDRKVSAALPGPVGKIAFTRFPNGILVMDPDGSNLVEVYRGSSAVGRPRWSPEGSRLAFTEPYVPGALRVLSLDGSTVQTVVPAPAVDPAWSPDGTRLAFRGPDGIEVVNVDGTGRQLVLAGEWHRPAWSPDGARLAVDGQPASFANHGIYLFAIGGAPVALTPTMPDAYGPDWSPDGTRISFSQHDWIRSVDVATGTVSPVVFCNGCHSSWAPDGSRIAYTKPVAGSAYERVFTVRPDGSDDRQLTDDRTNGSALYPAWGSRTAAVAGAQPSPAPPPPTTPATTLVSPSTTVATGPTTTVRSREQVVRLGGTDRMATSVAVSTHTWASVGDTLDTRRVAQSATLARSDHFADALAGAPLASARQGPLLITPSEALDGRVEAELRRILGGRGTVHVLGGTSAISTVTAGAVERAGYTVVRYAGADRYATAAVVAREGLSRPRTVFLANGLDFPDALAAGPAAIRVGAAVLLTVGAGQSAPTAAYLDEVAPASVYAVGGAAARAAPSAEAIVGADRFDTAARIAWRFFGDARAVGVASGEVFPDALSGAPDAAALGGPLLLVTRLDVPGPVAEFLVAHRSGLQQGSVYGGTAVVEESVRQQVLALIS